MYFYDANSEKVINFCGDCTKIAINIFSRHAPENITDTTVFRQASGLVRHV